MRLYLAEDENIEDYDIDRKTIDCYFKKYNIQFCDFNVEIKDIGSAEARATDRGLILLNSKNGNKVVKSVLDHEIAHQLCNCCYDLQIDVILNYGYAFGKGVFRNGNFIGFDGNYGCYNPEESFCDSVSYYINYPNSLKSKYPDTYKVIDYMFKNNNDFGKFYQIWYEVINEFGIIIV